MCDSAEEREMEADEDDEDEGEDEKLEDDDEEEDEGLAESNADKSWWGSNGGIVMTSDWERVTAAEWGLNNSKEKHTKKNKTDIIERMQIMTSRSNESKG